MFIQDNIKFVKTSQTTVKEKCDHMLKLSARNKGKLNHIIDTYRLKIRGGCRGLPLLPMQYPEMAHINFQS